MNQVALAIPDLAAHLARYPTLAQLEAHRRAKERLARLEAAVRLSLAPPPPRICPLTAQFAEAHRFLDSIGMSYPTIKRIQRVVAAHYQVSVNDIVSARRTANVVKPRMVAVYLARAMTPKSLPEIGRSFGGRDHTTALHSCQKIAGLIEADPEFAAHVEALRQAVREGEI